MAILDLISNDDVERPPHSFGAGSVEITKERKSELAKNAGMTQRVPAGLRIDAQSMWAFADRNTRQ